MNEMRAFIVDMLESHPPTSGKIGEELHRRFKNLPETPNELDSLDELPEGSLIVPISSDILSTMYAFSELRSKRGFPASEMHETKKNKISNHALIDLSDLLQATLPEHKDPRIRAAHFEALEKVQEKLNNISDNSFLETVNL